ncbi:MAG: type VI secretion system baseplate subunit TssE [Candidatus Sulfotelmatobacter sp.]
MARISGDSTVTLSVLDRLIDREPKNQSEAPLGRAQSERLLKAAVQRDLEWLLNTRRIFQAPDESLKEVNRSVYNFGLPDFSQYTMISSGDQSRLIRQVVTAIQTYEPRLANVRIIPLESGVIQQFHVRIEGMLLMDPSPQPVSFDTVIGLKSGAARISGGTSAG